MAPHAPEPTPEMIAAGADALEHVNGIGRWLAESLATSVLERAFEAHWATVRAKPENAEKGIIGPCSGLPPNGDAMCWCGKVAAGQRGCHPTTLDRSNMAADPRSSQMYGRPLAVRIEAMEGRIADLEARLARLAQPAAAWPQGHHVSGVLGHHTHGVALDCHGFIPCGSRGCCTIRCRHS